jgi:hypothetical protein
LSSIVRQHLGLPREVYCRWPVLPVFDPRKCDLDQKGPIIGKVGSKIGVAFLMMEAHSRK